MRDRRLLPCFALGLMLLIVACTATQPVVTAAAGEKVPGFWRGFWHGFTSPVTFFVSLFSHEVRIFGVPNSGHWYDFGFMLGIGGFTGGFFAGSRGERPRK